MDIRELDVSQYNDIFATKDADPLANQIKQGVHFGRGDEQNQDIFNNGIPSSAAGETTEAPSASGETTDAPSAAGETTEKPAEDADILGGTKPEGGKGGRKPKYDFSDMTGYYEDRVKAGKFTQIYEETEEGKKEFLPKTPEDFDEVIEMQVEHKYNQKVKDIESNWYQTKSPAWQAVARYAEMVDDPAELVPFIEGVRTINSVAQVNEDEIEGAEQIVRVRLEQRGDPKEVIDSQVESMKTSDTLIKTAKQYKPLILQEEQRNLAQMVQENKRREQEYIKIVDNVRGGVVKAIEAPIFGKQNLKREEKVAIYNLIAEPSEELGGYPIYNAIDSLFEKGDFETLKKVALLLAKEDSFVGYISTSTANKTAEELQRKLRLAADSKATGNDIDTGDNPVIQRNQYKSSTPRFGRG